MIKIKNILKLYALLIVLLSSSLLVSQNNKQKALEIQRQELRKEIQKFTELRLKNKTKARSELSLIEDFNYKINALNTLIKVTNQQANLLTREINSNQKQITSLRNELAQLKEAYAAMIVKSYKSKNQQSRIMFLLSSNNFKQAYKRLSYLKQYANYQKEQGQTIKAKTKKLQAVNNTLLQQKKDKQHLVNENKVVQKALEKERAQHNALMQSIQKNISKYDAQIKQKQREAAQIDKAIEDIIKAAIAKSRTKTGTSKTANTTEFSLTAEEKVLASNFIANKGKLPWPVEKGLVTLRYGKQPSPINKYLTINSSGVRIATEKDAQARAIFNGEVSKILRIKNASIVVMVRHGNYTTAYKNLSKVFVKEGDKVKTKQALGEVFTNPANGETILSFVVFKDSQTQNPASWIYKM